MHCSARLKFELNEMHNDKQESLQGAEFTGAPKYRQDDMANFFFFPPYAL